MATITPCGAGDNDCNLRGALAAERHHGRKPSRRAPHSGVPARDTGERQSDQRLLQTGHKSREKYTSFKNAVFRDNPLLPTLLQNLYIAESDAWRQWDTRESGLRFTRAITAAVEGEMAKVKIPAMSSITLTSTDADIPLPVTNETGYRMKATLQFNSNGLTFPKGQMQQVILEPKENMLEIPVHVTKKGRVRSSPASRLTGPSSRKPRCRCSRAASILSQSSWSAGSLGS